MVYDTMVRLIQVVWCHLEEMVAGLSVLWDVQLKETVQEKFMSEEALEEKRRELEERLKHSRRARSAGAPLGSSRAASRSTPSTRRQVTMTAHCNVLGMWRCEGSEARRLSLTATSTCLYSNVNAAMGETVA